MSHEPGGLVGYVEHPMELVGGHAFLGSTHKMDGKKPLGKRKVAILEDRANGDSKLFLTARALPDAAPNMCLAVRLRLQPISCPNYATMRTDHAIPPAQLFQEGAGLVFTAEISGQVYEIRVIHNV